MKAKKLAMLLLVVFSLVSASFVLAEIKDGLNIRNAEAAPTGGNILYVGGSGPNNYTKIQDAIDDASSGDTVFVYNGTYKENLDIGKSIRLLGEDKNNTIIDGNHEEDLVYIVAKFAEIKNFSLVNGWHHCILLEEASHNVIQNNLIFNTSGPIGSGGIGITIDPNSYYNVVRNNEIFNNIHYGILLGANSSFNIIENNLVYSNRYHGIHLDNGSNNYITSNHIYNTAGDGINLHRYSFNNVISENSIYNNSECGIVINTFNGPANNNILYHNNLINNSPMAHDDGSNVWYNIDLQEGNYWSDFDEPSEGAYDNNSDGIADSPRDILGGDNQDRYPLMYQYPNTAPPAVEILRPNNYLYIGDREIIPTDSPIIFGKITVKADATDDSGIKKVEFYIDDNLKETIEKEPFEWLWNETAFFKHSIKVIAYDKAGNTASDEIDVIIFNI